MGKKANIFKARYLHGNGGRICGGHKCEGRAPYPGRSARPASVLLASRGAGMGWRMSAEAIVVAVTAATKG